MYGKTCERRTLCGGVLEVSSLVASSNIGIIYHLTYLVLLGKLIAGPGITNLQLSHLVACFVVQIYTNPDNKLVHTRLCLLNLDLFLKKNDQLHELVSGGLQFL